VDASWVLGIGFVIVAGVGCEEENFTVFSGTLKRGAEVYGTNVLL
jgi:hypothetical protein